MCCHSAKYTGCAHTQGKQKLNKILLNLHSLFSISCMTFKNDNAPEYKPLTKNTVCETVLKGREPLLLGSPCCPGICCR